MRLTACIMIALTFFSGYLTAQNLTACELFDTSPKNIIIDSNGIWEIGSPNKITFDSSYSVPNSIITGLSVPYRNNDTSSFKVIFKDTTSNGLPNYLGLYPPLEVEFHHRFKIDSTNDYGQIDISFDDKKWFNFLLLTDDYYASTFHNVESSNDTIDSLAITGFSNGWIHSKLSKEIGTIIQNYNYYNADSLILKFSLVSDSVNVDEGWQIDNLCLKMDLSVSVSEISDAQNFSIFPNPNTGDFKIKLADYESGFISIFDTSGKLIQFIKIEENMIEIPISGLTKGLYLVRINQTGKVISKKVLVEN